MKQISNPSMGKCMSGTKGTQRGMTSKQLMTSLQTFKTSVQLHRSPCGSHHSDFFMRTMLRHIQQMEDVLAPNENVTSWCL